jgi:hypothetical protein
MARLRPTSPPIGHDARAGLEVDGKDTTPKNIFHAAWQSPLRQWQRGWTAGNRLQTTMRDLSILKDHFQF